MQVLPNELLMHIFDTCPPVMKAHVLSLVSKAWAYRYRPFRVNLKVLSHTLHRNLIDDMTRFFRVFPAQMNSNELDYQHSPAHARLWSEFRRQLFEIVSYFENHRLPALSDIEEEEWSGLETGEPSADGWWSDDDDTMILD